MQETDSGFSDTLCVPSSPLNRVRKEEELDLERMETLAEDSFGTVFRCRDLSTGLLWATKEITINDPSEGVPGSILREASILQVVAHPTIVALLKVKTSEHTQFVNLIFENLDCDLHNYLHDPSPMDAKTIKSFTYQILSAVAHCHRCMVLHRDLKPKNLLIDRSRKLIKLAGFSSACHFANPDLLRNDNIGIDWYRAPEILCDSPQYSTAVDIWSVGCVFAEMVIGKPLFQSIDCPDRLEAIFKLLGTPTEDTWPGFTELMSHRQIPEFKPFGIEKFVTDLEPAGLSLLSMMLCLNPIQRISAEDALKHAYFSDVDERMLCLNPIERISAEDALNHAHIPIQRISADYALKHAYIPIQRISAEDARKHAHIPSFDDLD